MLQLFLVMWGQVLPCGGRRQVVASPVPWSLPTADSPIHQHLVLTREYHILNAF